MNDKTQPVHNIRVGNINVAIWEQQAQNGNFMNATFSRSYKSGEEWKTAHTYTVNQLGDLRRAAMETETYINEHTRDQPGKEADAMDRFEARNEQSGDERDNETER